ncbi:hypothetical protein A9Q79_07900 [Methylophaga sp. 42_25_T18]|nr:hypothetical protein A9Q79_07900 [Methylophaga sp. 42_25_T18]
MKKVCVTGANGFIGRRLVDELIMQGYDVTVLSRRDNDVFPAMVKLVKGDLTAVDCALEQFISNCDVVFHCAGEIHDTKLMKALHVDGTQRLIQAVLKKSKQRKQPIHWVQLSSVGVYGPPTLKANEERTVTEDSPVRPKGEYEETKAKSDQLVMRAGARGLMSYTIIRPSNVFGIGMPNKTLRELAKVVQKGLYFHIGYLSPVATYVHVNDVVELLVNCGHAKGAKREIFNISNDCQLEELIGGMASSHNVKQPWLRFPESLVRLATQIMSHFVALPLTKERIDALVSRTSYPTSKLERKLGFYLSTSVPDEIDKFVKAE